MAGFLRRLLLGADADEYWSHYRKYHAARTGLFRKYHSLCCQRICGKCSASVPVTVSFQGKPVFPHGLNGILISKDAVLGNGCVIFQQVTIGSNTLPDAKTPGSPVLGDHVYVGAGAKIIGGVRVGDNVRVGANCVVFRDIPDNATVVLPSPRVILRETPQDNRFLRRDQI